LQCLLRAGLISLQVRHGTPGINSTLSYLN